MSNTIRRNGHTFVVLIIKQQCKLLNVEYNSTEWTYGLEVFIRLLGGEDRGIDLDGRGEVLIEDGEREFGGVDADRTESFVDTGTAVVLRVGDRLEVLEPIVCGDTVLVVDTGLFFGYRSYPREIDGMGNENVFVCVPWMFKLQIPLFAIGIGFNLTVLAGSRCGVQQFLNTRRRDLQADCTVKREIEPIPVVGFVGDEVQECALVQEKWINRMIHIHRISEGC